ncbi:FAD-binding oxidoreductase [Planosporangium thailandense]|uniref:D-amino-acid oxidase n=1 Tax=Planosporangium thailandense TaxID=765197 RepID=A0ABX0Y2G4_9ACTN|nr:FAD-dependent oxidoreductase [Planosporangium thailandense]NJC71622.1 FAD-binding oxidoreductase [Planosporangium thailandense]
MASAYEFRSCGTRLAVRQAKRPDENCHCAVSFLAGPEPSALEAAAGRAGDDVSVIPIRGQLVVVENPGISEFFSEDTGLSPDLLYFYPQGETLLLGGTAQPGTWNREPDPLVAAAIVARCTEIAPFLRDAPIIEHRVGLRPSRPAVRIEEQQVSDIRVIHNYGHGGAGVTLSWGCATEVASRATS